MRITAGLVAVALLASAPARGQDEAATAAAGQRIEGVVFIDDRQDAEAVQKRLTDLLQRTAVRLQGSAGTLSRPLVETLRSRSSRRRAEPEAVEMRVTLPEAISRDAFLAALAEDSECVSSHVTCDESCQELAQGARGGHWHMLPDGGRGCLAAFFPDEDSANELERTVAKSPKRYAVGRSARAARVRVTIGRPEFPPEIDEQP